MSNIPQARKELDRIADDLAHFGNEANANRIRQVISTHLIRKPPVRKTRAKSEPMSAALANDVRVFAKAYPHMSNQEIANCFSINAGRVSEALNNLR